MKLASVVLLLAACGGGSDPVPDPDSSVPDPDGPAQDGRVDVTVYKLDLANPAVDPDAIVIFHDPNDVVVSHGSTNAVGQAFGLLPEGGSVTVIRTMPLGGAQRSISIITIREVAPGDNVLLDFHRFPEERLTGAEDTMVATYTPIDNTNPQLIKPCGASTQQGQPGTPVTLQFFEDCTTPEFDMLALHAGSFVWMPDVPYAGGTTVEVPNTWQPMGTLGTSVTGVIADQLYSRFVFLRVGPIKVEMDRGQFFGNEPTASHPWPPGAGRGAVIRIGHVLGISSDDTHVFVVDEPEDSVALDLNALPLPVPLGRATQTADSVSWTESGEPGGDLRIVTWRAKRTTASSTDLFFWNVVENPASGSGTTELPALPEDYEEFDPHGVIGLALEGAAVTYCDADHIAGYAAARLRPHYLSQIDQMAGEGMHHGRCTNHPN